MKSEFRLALMLALACLFAAGAAQAQAATPARSPHTQAPEAHSQGAGHGAGHHAHRFENAAEWAKEFDDPARDQWQMPSRVIEALNIKPGQIVADIGAGTGYFTVRLAKTPAKPKVYAVDIEKSMVDHLRRRATQEGLKNVIPIQATAGQTNLPEPVDLVLIVDTYHHIPDRVAYFLALKAKMKPGAQLAIVDFRKDSPTGPPPEYRFTPEQISAELAKAGFSLQKSFDFLPRQIFLVFVAK